MTQTPVRGILRQLFFSVEYQWNKALDRAHLKQV